MFVYEEICLRRRWNMDVLTTGMQPMFTWKQFIFTREHLIFTREQFMFTREQFLCTREQFMFTWEQFMLTREELMLTREQFMFTWEQQLKSNEQTQVAWTHSSRAKITGNDVILSRCFHSLNYRTQMASEKYLLIYSTYKEARRSLVNTCRTLLLKCQWTFSWNTKEISWNTTKLNIASRTAQFLRRTINNITHYRNKIRYKILIIALTHCLMPWNNSSKQIIIVKE